MTAGADAREDRPRLALLQAFAAALAAEGDARARLQAALALVGGTYDRAVVEVHEPDGTQTTLDSRTTSKAGAALAALESPLRGKQRTLGRFILFARTFDEADRVVAELLANQIALHLQAEQRANAEPSELEALLLGIVGHDLRTPLGVVTLAATALLEGDLNEFQRKTVLRVMAAGRQSERLVSDLLDFTVARRARIELVRRAHDLHALVALALDDLRQIWPGRELVHERSGDGSSFVDEGRILQVVMNLVGNALQHSPATTTVRIETRGGDGSVEFSVANEGPPIPDRLVPELFAPLRRGEGAGPRRGSIGLGLFIVQHLVLAHGGTIDVTSNEREGTRFTVRLPAISAAPCA